MARAIGLLSGGLDSILACRLILEQGIEVIAANFISPFYTDTRNGSRHPASHVAAELGIELRVLSVGQEYIELIKNPKYGRGRNMNPCIDCRIFTLRRAREFAETVAADFVFTGEVLGQRPMSQHRQALQLIERESGLEGRLLRPLSALLLKPTIPEKTGIVNRERLLAISGRSREIQIRLAAKLGISDYPSPAGGCLLTDRQFSIRLRDAFAHGEESLRDMQLLKLGRHFRLASGAKVIVGRNEAENAQLRALTGSGESLVEAEDVVGPVTVVLKPASFDDLKTAARICARYSDGRNGPVRFRIDDQSLSLEPISDHELRLLRICESVRR